MKNEFENFVTFGKTVEENNSIYLQATTYGYEKKETTQKISNNRNFEYSIHFILSGYGYICYENNTPIKVRSGDIFFLLPYDGKITYYPTDSKPYEYCWINCIGNISDILKRINICPTNPVVKIHNKAEIKKIFSDMFFAVKKYPNFSKFICANAINNILFLLLKNTESEKRQKNYFTHIDKAQKYIEEHYSDEDLSIDEVAKHCALNTAYFSRLFREKMGIKFSTYLMDYRIRMATSLISQGLHSIKILSYTVGFSSPYYFSNQFLKIVKIRPKEYIEQIKQLEKENKQRNP